MKKAFARVGAKMEGVSAQSIIDAIIDERPDLKGQTFHTPGYGGACHTFIVGDEVFKSPRQEGMHVTLFEKEIANMQRLLGKGVAAPELTYVGKKNYFYGMTRMKGIVMSEAMLTMSDMQMEKLAEDIGRVAADVARVFDEPDVNTAGEAGFTDRTHEVAGYLQNPRIAKRFGGDIEFVHKQIADYYARMKDRKFAGYHADLHEDNILVDPKTKRLTAFIDFGAIHHTIAEDTMARIRFSFEPAAQEKMWMAYAGSSGADKRDYFVSTLVWEIDTMLRDRSDDSYLPPKIRRCVDMLKKLDAPVQAPQRKQAPAC